MCQLHTEYPMQSSINIHSYFITRILILTTKFLFPMINIDKKKYFQSGNQASTSV